MQAGEMLLSIEAIKMVTARHAEYDGAIADVVVRVGDQIDAKDLLILSPDGAAAANPARLAMISASAQAIDACGVAILQDAEAGREPSHRLGRRCSGVTCGHRIGLATRIYSISSMLLLLPSAQQELGKCSKLYRYFNRICVRSFIPTGAPFSDHSGTKLRTSRPVMAACRT
ncbi:hypothetical protein MXD81_65265 [Microbacteriaceae bacterium K1510]|nr:hypothetical protein [Microbacteriaceae bacterium K1510]